MYTKFHLQFQGIHGLPEVHPWLFHKTVHEQVNYLSDNIIPPLPSQKLSYLFLKTLELYSSNGKQSQQSRKGNILTILMKAGLFIKLAMSKLTPVPVCKTIISENYSKHYNLIIVNDKIFHLFGIRNLQDQIPLLTSVLLFSDLIYRNHFQGQDLMPSDNL